MDSQDTTATPTWREKVQAPWQNLTKWYSRFQLEKPVVESTALSDPIYNMRSTIIRGGLLLACSFGTFSIWLVFAPLTSAAIAPGVVKVAGERQSVQHLEGGIVDEILVEEGARVEAGEVLVRLDPTQINSARDQLQGRLVNLEASAARLRVVRDGEAELAFTPELQQRAEDLGEIDILVGEQRLFQSRFNALQGQRQILGQRIARFRDEVRAYEAQQKASEEQLKYIREELDAVREIYEQGMFEKPKYLALQRSVAKLGGEIGELQALAAQTAQRIGETELEILNLDNQSTSAAAADLQVVQAEILKTKEQLVARQDIYNRLEVVAPAAGVVVGLRYHTKGGVIAPGEHILDIVPSDVSMVIEARLRPQDIDVVRTGLPCNIQLSAYSLRSTPALSGTVLQVSADSFVDEFSQSHFYKTLVEVDVEALAALDNVSLYPGMTAEVFIVTGRRSALDYLLEPIVKSMRRSFKE